MIYDVVNMIEGLGGMENARRCVDEFRAKVIAAGHPGLDGVTGNLQIKKKHPAGALFYSRRPMA